jgi:hypothetical protein
MPRSHWSRWATRRCRFPRVWAVFWRETSWRRSTFPRSIARTSTDLPFAPKTPLVRPKKSRAAWYCCRIHRDGRGAAGRGTAGNRDGDRHRGHVAARRGRGRDDRTHGSGRRRASGPPCGQRGWRRVLCWDRHRCRGDRPPRRRPADKSRDGGSGRDRCGSSARLARPRVAVISTGDEIIPPGEPMRPGMVFDSNARIIADAVRELGGEPVEYGIVRDDLLLRQRVAEAMAGAMRSCCREERARARAIFRTAPSAS